MLIIINVDLFMLEKTMDKSFSLPTECDCTNTSLRKSVNTSLTEKESSL